MRIGVALPFTEGFGPNDRAQLDAIEDTVERLSGARARLVLVLTTPQMREMVLHAAAGDWIPRFHQDLRHSLPKYDVQVMAEQDPNWSVYFQFAANA